MKMDSTVSCRSLAMEILREEMHRPYLPSSNCATVKTEPISRLDNSDSGMEDGGSSSPISSVTSDAKISASPDSDSDVGSGNTYKSQPLIHSEGSAFSKIHKPFIPGAECLYPSLTPLSMMYPASNGLAYFPSIPMNPWIPRDSYPKSSPHPHPCSLPHTLIKEPGNDAEEMEQCRSQDDNVFYHVDPRIPFTNYFMNLTKLFQKEPNSNVSKKTDTLYDKRSADEDCHSKKIVETDSKSDPESEISEKCLSPVGQSSELPTGKEYKTMNNASNSASATQNSPAYANNKFSSLHPHQFPSKLSQLEGFSSQLSSFQSNASMMHYMGGIPAPGGMFHPAFLQMTGLGSKRLNPEKPPPVKKYKCDVCGKAFSRSNTLVTHKRIHTGDKPFKCEVCGRAFRQPGNLTRHRLTHTTIKPYVCPTCNKAFNRASNLHTHMRTHTNYRPFICPYCGKGFHQKIDMKIHCYTHTGERPHRCDICGKGFTLASTLNTHRRLHCDQTYL